MEKAMNPEERDEFAKLIRAWRGQAAEIRAIHDMDIPSKVVWPAEARALEACAEQVAALVLDLTARKKP